MYANSVSIYILEKELEMGGVMNIGVKIYRLLQFGFIRTIPIRMHLHFILRHEFAVIVVKTTGYQI